MQNLDEFGTKILDGKSVLGLALLVPALFWWAAVAISLAAVTGIAEFLGTSLMQVIILVICPLLAVMVSLGTEKRSTLRWIIAGVGVAFTAMAFLASVRAS